MNTICGADCSACMLRKSCPGCAATKGHPFGKECLLAVCTKEKQQESCANCGACSLRNDLIGQFNSLGIADMEPITALYALKGSFINMTYKLPGGQPARFWDDDKIYLGCQTGKLGSSRCYGLAADEKYLMVCEYNPDGTGAEIVEFRRWK